MEPEGQASTAAIAQAIALRAADLVVEAVSAEKGVLLQAVVYQCVLRAMGCTCRTSPEQRERGGPVFFEDITCSLHGIGPIDEREPRFDPGD